VSRYGVVIHGRRFHRYYWRGKVFSVRRQQGYSIALRIGANA
jgi:hypothetical protein